MNTTQKDKIITFKIFSDPTAADFAKKKLEENGIECFLEDENVIGLNPLGGTELKIFAEDIERVKTLILTPP